MRHKVTVSIITLAITLFVIKIHRCLVHLTGVIAGKVVPTERQDLKPTHMTSWAIFSSVSFQTCCNQEGSLHVFALEVAVKHGAHRSSHKPKIAGTNLIGEEVEEV